MGWAVAVNSLGSFLASPLFGMWADRRTTREVLAATLVIMIIGNVGYALSINIWILLISRFVVGVAAANYAVAQTYLSYATTQDLRTRVMAMNSAATVLGFIVGPALSYVFTFFKFSINEINVNSSTMPGYFSGILSLGGLISLIFLRELPKNPKQSSGGNRAPSSKTDGAGSTRQTPQENYAGSGFYTGGGSVRDLSQVFIMKNKIPFAPVMISLFAYLCYTTSFTVFETVGSIYTGDNYGWGDKQNSILFMGLGGVCVISLVILQVFVRFFNDRLLLACCTSLSVAGFALLFVPWEDSVPFWRFFLGCGLASASYSTSVALLISIYTKVLEGLDQGMMMGWLSSAGSIARIVGPIVASYSYQYGRGHLVFLEMVIVMAVVLVVVSVSYKFLSPRQVKSNVIINS